jgi:hypothetical protein
MTVAELIKRLQELPPEWLVNRAKAACFNSGEAADLHFSRLREESQNGQAGAPRINYRLTRYGAYLLAMNGDPAKQEIAAEVLRAEADENTCRKPLTPYEASYARERRAKVLSEDAAKRKAQAPGRPRGEKAAEVSGSKLEPQTQRPRPPYLRRTLVGPARECRAGRADTITSSGTSARRRGNEHGEQAKAPVFFDQACWPDPSSMSPLRRPTHRIGKPRIEAETIMSGEKLATIATKLPATLRDAFADLAKRRRLTPSRLLRSLVERELAGGPDDDGPGEVETATVAELTDRGADLSGARAAAAVNLARRMDRDPTSGAPNAAQLRQLLGELSPVLTSGDFDELTWIRLSASFRLRGWHLVDEHGQSFAASDVPPVQRDAIIAEIAGGRRPVPSATDDPVR